MQRFYRKAGPWTHLDMVIGHCCFGHSGKINFKGIYIFFKLKKWGKKSKQTHDTGALSITPILKLCLLWIFIHINITRNMGMSLLLTISSLCAMTDMSEDKQAGFPPIPPP